MKNNTHIQKLRLRAEGPGPLLRSDYWSSSARTQITDIGVLSRDNVTIRYCVDAEKPIRGRKVSDSRSAGRQSGRSSDDNGWSARTVRRDWEVATSNFAFQYIYTGGRIVVRDPSPDQPR